MLFCSTRVRRQAIICNRLRANLVHSGNRFGQDFLSGGAYLAYWVCRHHSRRCRRQNIRESYVRKGFEARCIFAVWRQLLLRQGARILSTSYSLTGELVAERSR